MQRDAARLLDRRWARAGELGALTLLGFGAGLAAGFLLAEGLGSRGHRRVGRLLRRRENPRETSVERGARVSRLKEALAAEPMLAGEPLEVRARPRGLELRGSVASRPARTLAYRVARQLAEGGEIINHIHVREDDGRSDDPDVAPDPESPAPPSSIQPRSA